MPAPLILAAVLAVVPRADTLRVVPHASPIVLRATYDSLETWSLANGVRSAGRPFAQRLTRSGEVWRLEVRYYDAEGRLSTTRVYESDARTHIAVHAATDSAEIVVNDGRVSGYVAPARKPQRSLDEPLLHAPFEHSVADYVIAAQKLTPAWRAVVSVYEPFREGEPEFVWEAGVVGRERITAAGRTRDCWVVEQRDPSGQFATNTLWIDVRTRRIWQSRGRPAGGTFEWWHRVLNPCCRAPGWGHATAPARGRRGREERHARAHLQAHAVAQTVEPHQRHVPKVRS